MGDAIPRLSAASLARSIRAGNVSPVAAVEAYLTRIEARNDVVKAYVTVLADRAREAAREAERAVDDGESLGPLHGVPVAIKDLEDVAGVPTTLGLKPLADNVADRNALIVQRLREAGAIVLGKTNTPELGHKGTTDNPLFGPTVTPFDLGKTAGGSSGGGAAAVADGLCALAQGSDGSGSIRIPASFCGVFGFKPSFGRIPTKRRPDGFVADRPFSDIGPLTRTVEDAALMLNVMAGPHPRDPFSLPEYDGGYVDALDNDLSGVDVAYSPNLDVFQISPVVQDLVEDAVDSFAAAGATVEQVSMDWGCSLTELRDTHWTYNLGKTALEAEVIERQYGIDLLARNDVSPHIAQRIEEGQALSLREYRRADLRRTKVFDRIQDVLGDYDLLVTPTLSITAFDVDLYDQETEVVNATFEVDGKPVPPRGGWFLTWPFNLSGHPAASIPAGTDDDGLPAGLQVIGQRHADADVLAASAAFEAEQPWHDDYPYRLSA